MLAQTYPSETGLLYALPQTEACDFAASDFSEKIFPRLMASNGLDPAARPLTRVYDFRRENITDTSAIAMLTLVTSNGAIHLPTIRALVKVVESTTQPLYIRAQAAGRFKSFSRAQIYENVELASLTVNAIFALEQGIKPILEDVDSASPRATARRASIAQRNREATASAQEDSKKLRALAEELRKNLGFEDMPDYR